MVDDDRTLVHELLEMAGRPERFSKPELGEMLLVAATEIIKLQELGPSPTTAQFRRSRLEVPKP